MFVCGFCSSFLSTPSVLIQSPTHTQMCKHCSNPHSQRRRCSAKLSTQIITACHCPTRFRFSSCGAHANRHHPPPPLPPPVKPLTVQILNPPTPLVADRRYEVACESAGCRPNAIITWYKGKRQLRRTKVRPRPRVLVHDHHTNAPT